MLDRLDQPRASTSSEKTSCRMSSASAGSGRAVRMKPRSRSRSRRERVGDPAILLDHRRIQTHIRVHTSLKSDRRPKYCRNAGRPGACRLAQGLNSPIQPEPAAPDRFHPCIAPKAQHVCPEARIRQDPARKRHRAGPPARARRTQPGRARSRSIPCAGAPARRRAGSRPADAALQAILGASPATAELYENLHYEKSGLSRSPLDRSVGTEMLTSQALHRIAKAGEGPGLTA